MREDRSWVAVMAAGLGVVAFAVLFIVGTRSFLHAIAEMAESETRVTIVNKDGTVFYDTDSAVGSHAGREEVREAFAKGRSVALRRSETVGKDLLYCARRVGERVVRLAVPYTGVLKSERLAWTGLAAAVLLGISVVLLVYFSMRRLRLRLDRQARALAIAAANESFRREFTSNVTHELKSPITAILGAVEMLGDGSAISDDEKKELFGIVQGECAHLGSLVKDVLSLAEIEREESLGRGQSPNSDGGLVRGRSPSAPLPLPPAPSPLPLNEIIDVVVARESAKARKAHMTLTVLRNDAVQVRGDATRLEEVLVNLIENAFRYSGSDRIEVASAAAGNRVTVSVTDHGVGIPAEHLPHLYERFYRVSKSRSRALGGTGLGLAIVKHIVQLHGGEVAVTSDPGRETVFSFTLPLDK